MYLENADHINSSGVTTTGKFEIANLYKEVLSSTRYKLSLHETEHIKVKLLTETIAIVDVKTKLTGLVSNSGKIEDRAGMYTAVVQKLESGWKIAALRSMVPQ